MEENRNDVPMIPKHQAQAQMMHMSWTIRWLVIGIIIGFLCMLTQAFIFVKSYTSRTERWLNTYNELVKRVYGAEEQKNEENQTGDLQQLPLP